MAYTELLTGHGLTVKTWEEGIFSEYLGMLFWSNLMGTKDTAIIQIKDDLTKKKGDSITFGIRSQLLGGYVTGNAKGLGNEGRVDFYNQAVTIDNVRHLVKIEDIPMSSQRGMFSVLQAARDALVDKSKYRLEDDITAALTTISTERVRGRYLYGAADSNWNATHATALTAVDATNDMLTTSMIDIAKRKAILPVNATAKIRPARFKIGEAYEEWFTFVGHTYCIRDLVNGDASWKNAQLNLMPRSGNGASPIFTGSSFKGAWNGTLIYEWDRLPLISSTIQVAHNLFLGAQAGVIAWGQRPKFGEELQDIQHDVSYETHEIRGMTKVYFNRATPEDNGLVNLFAAAVSD